ncbi:hypothetical protein PR048_005332 [Dryococelus australis]|uniref:Integrase catalytic domain-containing protein n=1 Tax=Dryococelus australis TaxID=614101 RepID=A0ABQ9I802_9NEOP|nr:hypothetical protein PR048_005332 [Dryococelus australis]
MDKRIGELGNSCTAYQAARRNPATIEPQPWEFATSPWQRVHVNFLGLCNVAEVTSTAAIHTISFLNSLMARFGICTQLLSDNGPPFTSEGFQTFVRIRGIHHVTSPPYHPQYNGQAESSVKFYYMYKFKSLLLSGGKMHEKVFQFLRDVRNATQCTKGKSPTKLIFGRNIHIEYDLLHSGIAGVDGCQEKGSNMASELVVQEERGVEKSLGEVTGKTGEEGQEVA